MSRVKKIYTVKRKISLKEEEEIISFSSFLKAINYIDTVLLIEGIKVIVVNKDNNCTDWIYKQDSSTVEWAQALTNRNFINKAIYRGMSNTSLQRYIVTSTEVF